MSEDWLPPAWSKSQLQNLLEGCPWQWALKKVFGIDDPGGPATARGTAFHAAVELHERARLRQLRDGADMDVRAPAELYEQVRGVLGVEVEMLPSGTLEEHGTHEGKLQGELLNLIENWWSAATDEGPTLRERVARWRPVAIEPYFRVDLGNRRPAHGFIDQLYWDPDAAQWVVVDLKSAGSFRRWEGHWGHEVEAAMYAAGAALARGLPAGTPVRMEWHVVRPVARSRTVPLSRVVQVDPSDWPPERLAQQSIAEAERRVLAGDLPKNTAWNLCSPKWCSAYEGCEVTGELAPENLLPTLP